MHAKIISTYPTFAFETLSFFSMLIIDPFFITIYYSFQKKSQNYGYFADTSVFEN